MITQQDFGQFAGRKVTAFTITNSNGLRATVIPYGARLTALDIPDRDGKLADIVLGHDRIEDYIAGTAYFGATCGRYANRIAGGRLPLSGDFHQLDQNEGENHLHGGRSGFDTKVWEVEEAGEQTVLFSTESAAGEMGFPGACKIWSRYTLTDDNRLTLTMEAISDADTVMNMVNHSYFNLAGQGSGPVLQQHLRLSANHYTPVRDDLLPTGEILAVEDTPFDFRQSRPIGQTMAALPDPAGYDHNWCLAGGGTGLRLCAEAHDPASGRQLTLWTTEPGVQLYVGGYLDEGLRGKAGVVLGPHAGFTLETQKFPDSPNNPQFPSAHLTAGTRYHHQMVLAFSA